MNQAVLTIATHNAHKAREIQEILGPEFALHDLSARSDIPKVPETGDTFEENASLKAVTTSKTVAGLVLADDSGLEVDVLGGVPGVLSARYAGQPTDDKRNVQKLLNELDRIDPTKKHRTARFRCVI